MQGSESAVRQDPGGNGGPLDLPGHLRDQLMRWSLTLRGAQPRVALADGDDPRVVRAARWLATHTPVRPVLIVPGSPAASSDVEEVSAADLGRDPGLLATLEVRANGVPRDSGELPRLAEDPVYLAAALVAAGRVDACVGGATRPTGDVIRAGLTVIGLAPGMSTVSSSFLFVLPDGRRLAYGDCAVLPAPDEYQLAQIAVATARTYRELIEAEPAVAMLSFSTMGSAQHPEVDTVRAATGLARALEPGLCIDGEMQFDAAMMSSVASAKAVGSPVAGRANVLIFPNLAAGNIGYKITERLGGATAVGPIIQGLRAPMNDLSRGCSSSDVVAVSLLSAVQSVAAGADVRQSEARKIPRSACSVTGRGTTAS